MAREKKPTPNPGSDDAVKKGCTCPIFDNNHGRFPPYTHEGVGEWWYDASCPLHVTKWAG